MIYKIIWISQKLMCGSQYQMNCKEDQKMKKIKTR